MLTNKDLPEKARPAGSGRTNRAQRGDQHSTAVSNEPSVGNRMRGTLLRSLVMLLVVFAIAVGTTFVKGYPRDFFWVERAKARMPVWVRGNTASGIFVVYIHGGPGSSGIAE